MTRPLALALLLLASALPAAGDASSPTGAPASARTDATAPPAALDGFGSSGFV